MDGAMWPPQRVFHRGVSPVLRSRGGNVGAQFQGRKLLPGHIGIDIAIACESSETTIGAGYDTINANYGCVTVPPLRDQLRMLHIIRASVDDAGRQHFFIGQFRITPYHPFMFVARIGGFEQD